MPEAVNNPPAAAPATAPAPAAADAPVMGTPSAPATDAVGTTQPPVGQNGQQNQPPPGPFGGQGFLIVIILVWVVFLWMSNKNRKRRREEEQRKSDLKKGDRVVTIGLMHGVVAAFTDETVTLLTDPKHGAVMVFDRKAIYKILPRPGEEPAEAAKEIKNS